MLRVLVVVSHLAVAQVAAHVTNVTTAPLRDSSNSHSEGTENGRHSVVISRDPDIKVKVARSGQSCEAEMTGIRTQLALLEASAASTVYSLTKMEARMDKLATQQQEYINNTPQRKAVAFTAHMSRFQVIISTISPFVYDEVTTNIGNGYNPLTGVFTAPVSGLYVFYFQIMVHVSKSTIRAAIMKEGIMLARTTAEGALNSYDKGSALAATHVNKGEQVYVKWTSGGTESEGYWWNAFAGFLLLPDAA